MSERRMRAFWDARAREDAAYFVDTRLNYRQTDWAAFWAGGEEDLATIERLLEFRITPDEQVVEIGCGLGRLTRALASRAQHVIALDVSPEMVVAARGHNEHLHTVDWRVGDGETLAGVDTASVDGVISHVVFQHLPDPAITYGYVEEMGRVLKPGGWAAFQVSDHPALHRREPLRRLLGRRLSGGPRGAGHPAWLGSAVDLDHLRAVAAEAGLSVERILGEGSQYCLVLLRRGG